MDFTYKIPAEQLGFISKYQRTFRFINFTKYYNHEKPLNQWFQNFSYELLTLTYDVFTNVSFSHEYLLEENLNLLLTATKALKMFYQYGMVIQIIKKDFNIEEKGTHQNHVLELIIAKLKVLKECDNLKIKN